MHIILKKEETREALGLVVEHACKNLCSHRNNSFENEKRKRHFWRLVLGFFFKKSDLPQEVKDKYNIVRINKE